MSKLLTLLLFCAVATVSNAQELDTVINENVNNNIEEIVVTATKTETKIQNTTVPMSVIASKYIKASGTIKLGDLLQEQSGLQLSNFLGTGVQLQGLSAEYTLILINGEPIIGKNAGVVDLSRIVVNNIKRVEIVKGPVSCLYGSDAIGGVINIITEDVGKLKNAVDLSVQYKSPAILTTSLFSSFSKKKVSFENSVVHNYSNGFHTNKETIFKEGAPHNDFTFSNKLTVRANERIQAGIGLKYYYSKLRNQDNYLNKSDSMIVAKQEDKINEFNFSPFFKFVKNSIVLNIKNFNSYYTSTSNFSGFDLNDELYDDSFKQLLSKLEVQFDYTKKGHLFTAGTGGFYNLVLSNRNTKKIHQHQEFLFFQYQYDWKSKIIFNVGNRIDFPSDYAIQWLSPKASARFNVNKYFAIKISAGRGYKAPDVRQQYLNFTNALVGYSIYGAHIAAEKLSELEELGQIHSYSIPISEIKNLSPEKSWSANAEIEIKPIPDKLTISANYFRNQIDNMIEAIPTAIKTNNALIYTYYNLNKVYTQGVDAVVNYQIIKGLSLNVGYSFIDAKDEGILKKLKDGKIFRRDPETLETVRVTKKEYGGLFDRSKHSFTCKVYYENTKHAFSTYLRIIYRGKYGWNDNNGNQILDVASEYAKGYTLMNFSFTKSFKNKYHVMVGIDNMLNTKRPIHVPSMNGITAVVGLTINFLNTK
ncbi:MAG: TonB-dependent receptor [Chitinophagales bacterium]